MTQHQRLERHRFSTAPRDEHHNGGRPTCGKDDEPRRIYPQRFPRDEYLVNGYSNKDLQIQGFDGYFHVRCPYSGPRACKRGRHACHVDSMVIAVAGACPKSPGSEPLGSACGIYLGYEESGSLSYRIQDDAQHPHAIERAELHAAIMALELALAYARNGRQWNCDPQICSEPCRVRYVVIKSDSEHLVSSMIHNVRKWQSNGWVTAGNTPVGSQDLFLKLLRKVEMLETMLTAVDFWLVPSSLNKEADGLAKAGLRSSSYFD